MKLKQPQNNNYCATIIEIKTLVPLEKCDNVQGAIIFGNQVIVSKELKIGTIGLFFPLETQLSKEFLSANNLYRKKELNSDKEKTGYFEENGRIRAVKFRGHRSEGFFIEIESLSFTFLELNFKLGDEFDQLGGTSICNKYVIKRARMPGMPGSKNSKHLKKYETKLVDNQFRFHQDTSMLYKNLHKINPFSLISITYKVHGTSGISSKVLNKKKLSRWQKFLRFFGANIIETENSYLYASRKVIKNEELNPGAVHYYSEDIWKIAHEELKEFVLDGMTLYYEIVGYIPSGGAIQKDYDYGCAEKEHKILIYRITQTNNSGKVTELSAKQVQLWCKLNGLNAVPELYYGYAENVTYLTELNENGLDTSWRPNFLEDIKKKYNDKDCYMCSNKVPEEGCVIRIEHLGFEAYKAKSAEFYARETKQLDRGAIDIEEEN